MSDMTSDRAHLEKTITEMRKLNAETYKLLSEIDIHENKARAETRLNEKKVKWYELTLFFAAIMATVAVTKLFLS